MAPNHVSDIFKAQMKTNAYKIEAADLFVDSFR